MFTYLSLFPEMKPSIELKFYKYEKSERADSSNPFLFFSYLQPSNLLLKCLLLMLSVLNNLSITQLLPIFSSKYLPSQSLLTSSGIGTRQTSTTPVNPWESLCFSLMRRYTHILTISFIYQSLFYFAYKMPGIKIIVHFL